MREWRDTPAKDRVKDRVKEAVTEAVKAREPVPATGA